jgi:hypothetical protein
LYEGVPWRNRAPKRIARLKSALEYESRVCFAALMSNAASPAAYGLLDDVQQLI